MADDVITRRIREAFLFGVGVGVCACFGLLAFGFILAGCGPAPTDVRLIEQCRDLQEVLSKTDRALHSCEQDLLALAAPPAVPDHFTGPPAESRPLIDCWVADSGVQCCFQRHVDAQGGYISHVPLGCVRHRQEGGPMAKGKGSQKGLGTKKGGKRQSS